MEKQKVFIYGGATIIITTGMLIIKGIAHIFNSVVVTVLK